MAARTHPKGLARLLVACLAAACLSAACGQGRPAPPGADGVDAGVDGGLEIGDAGPDAGLDAGPKDGGHDAGLPSDGGFEEGDAGSDGGVDSGVDAGADAGTDAGSADAGPCTKVPTCDVYTGGDPTPANVRATCASGEYCLQAGFGGGVCVGVSLILGGGGNVAPYKALCDTCGVCTFTCGGTVGWNCPAACTPVTTAPPGCADCTSTCRVN
jgi:hypothetical protein